MTTALLDDAPSRLRETSRPVAEFFRLRLREAEGEPAIDEAGRSARVIILTEGLGNLKDRNFYTAEAVQSAAAVFEGTQFYLDHPSQSEEADRPERSVRDLAGYFYDCQVGRLPDPETGRPIAACFATLRFAESEPGRLAFDQVRTALDYQRRFPAAKRVYAGISINAGGISRPGIMRGMQVNVVTRLAEAFSADIVTKPARGGRFLTHAREAVAETDEEIAARVAAWQAQHGRR